MSRVRIIKIAAISVFLICMIIVGIALVTGSSKEAVTYRETAVEYGKLVVGITEDGSVDIGTLNQVFELDMSALQRVSADSSSTENNIGAAGGMVGMTDMTGMDMFTQLFHMTGENEASGQGEASNLTIEEVCVSVGQQVKEGDILYLLEEESVSGLKEELEANVAKAQADLEAVYADRELSGETAKYTYETSIAYGSYAGTEYSSTIEELQSAVAKKEKALNKAQAALEDYTAQLAQVHTDYETAQSALVNAEWSRDNTDKWEDTYLYAEYFLAAQTAKGNVESLEQSVEQLESRMKQARQNVETCTKELGESERALAQGYLSAAETKKLRELAYNTAEETYDIALSYLDDDVANQEKVCAQAQEKWNEFSSHITDNAVCAKYDGVITDVSLQEGDSIHTNDTLITLYNSDEVSMTVSVDEEDMADIAVGTQANISFTAYPGTIFQAEVTEISDAETDSSGNVTYEVTATLLGDVSRLFQGMTGEITFITKESKQVLYVSNRAIIRNGVKSYVKIKDSNGNIQKKEVTTGFSDGINVEIIEGLSQGDIVLIESKVSE